MSANAAVFFIDWDDLQLNVPNPDVPAQFYIANVGGAQPARAWSSKSPREPRLASICSPRSATRTRASARAASRAA